MTILNGPNQSHSQALVPERAVFQESLAGRELARQLSGRRAYAHRLRRTLHLQATHSHKMDNSCQIHLLLSQELSRENVSGYFFNSVRHPVRRRVSMLWGLL